MKYFFFLSGFAVYLIVLRYCLDTARNRGDKRGYDRGFREGHAAADHWWMNWEHEVTRMQKSIQNEERWP